MSDESSVLVFFCIVVILTCACIQGGVTYTIIKEKGYWSNGFWWGFFLGPIGLLVAILKPYIPQLVPQSQPEAVKKPENPEKLQNWKCSCGRENAYYISSCTCGRSKREVFLQQTEKKPVQPTTTTVTASAVTQKPQTSVKTAEPVKTAKPVVQSPKPPVIPKETPKQTPPKPAAASQFKNIEERRIAALKEYKALLDNGIISQEEFDERKKHILSL